jgi:hypothetical protein
MEAFCPVLACARVGYLHDHHLKLRQVTTTFVSLITEAADRYPLSQTN